MNPASRRNPSVAPPCRRPSRPRTRPSPTERPQNNAVMVSSDAGPGPRFVWPTCATRTAYPSGFLLPPHLTETSSRTRSRPSGRGRMNELQSPQGQPPLGLRANPALRCSAALRALRLAPGRSDPEWGRRIGLRLRTHFQLSTSSTTVVFHRFPSGTVLFFAANRYTGSVRCDVGDAPW